jgi:hypothetical protein
LNRISHYANSLLMYAQQDAYSQIQEGRKLLYYPISSVKIACLLAGWSMNQPAILNGEQMGLV